MLEVSVTVSRMLQMISHMYHLLCIHFIIRLTWGRINFGITISLKTTSTLLPTSQSYSLKPVYTAAIEQEKSILKNLSMPFPVI